MGNSLKEIGVLHRLEFELGHNAVATDKKASLEVRIR